MHLRTLAEIVVDLVLGKNGARLCGERPAISSDDEAPTVIDGRGFHCLYEGFSVYLLSDKSELAEVTVMSQKMGRYPQKRPYLTVVCQILGRYQQ